MYDILSSGEAAMIYFLAAHPTVTIFLPVCVFCVTAALVAALIADREVAAQKPEVELDPFERAPMEKRAPMENCVHPWQRILVRDAHGAILWRYVSHITDGDTVLSESEYTAFAEGRLS